MNPHDAPSVSDRDESWLSIIVLGYNRFAETSRRCLDSLAVEILDSDIEVILIDNGSSDDSAALSRQYCSAQPRIRFLPNNANLGFAGGMNAGVEIATGKYVLLANSDLIFPPGAINTLRQVIDARPEVDILAPVTNAAGNAQALPKLGTNETQVLAAAVPLHARPSGHVYSVYRADFFCVAVKRAVWRALGGLDTGFGRGYYEDFDFSLRARAAGYKLALTEDVVIFHAGSQSFARIGAEQRDLIRRNKRRLQAMHHNVRFLHQREDNLDMLKQYAVLLERGDWNEGLERRLWLRVAEAQHNLPRSPIKRFLWKRKVALVMAKLNKLHGAQMHQATR